MLCWARRHRRNRLSRLCASTLHPHKHAHDPQVWMVLICFGHPFLWAVLRKTHHSSTEPCRSPNHHPQCRHRFMRPFGQCIARPWHHRREYGERRISVSLARHKARRIFARWTAIQTVRQQLHPRPTRLALRPSRFDGCKVRCVSTRRPARVTRPRPRLGVFGCVDRWQRFVRQTQCTRQSSRRGHASLSPLALSTMALKTQKSCVLLWRPVAVTRCRCVISKTQMMKASPRHQAHRRRLVSH